MGLRGRFVSFFKHWHYRLFELPRRFDEIVIQFENLIQEFHSHNTCYLESKYVWDDLTNAIKEVDENAAHQHSLIRKQIKRNETKTKNELDNIVKTLIKLDDNSHAIDGLMSQLRKELGQFHAYKKKYDSIDGLHDKLEQDYDHYLERLKNDISKFKERDQAVMRLAHLEERITLIEIANREKGQHGSGENLSGSARTHQAYS